MKDLKEQTVEISVEEYCTLKEKANKTEYMVSVLDHIFDKLRDIEDHLYKMGGGAEQ